MSGRKSVCLAVSACVALSLVCAALEHDDTCGSAVRRLRARLTSARDRPAVHAVPPLIESPLVFNAPVAVERGLEVILLRDSNLVAGEEVRGARPARREALLESVARWGRNQALLDVGTLSESRLYVWVDMATQVGDVRDELLALSAVGDTYLMGVATAPMGGKVPVPYVLRNLVPIANDDLAWQRRYREAASRAFGPCRALETWLESLESASLSSASVWRARVQEGLVEALSDCDCSQVDMDAVEYIALLNVGYRDPEVVATRVELQRLETLSDSSPISSLVP